MVPLWSLGKVLHTKLQSPDITFLLRPCAFRPTLMTLDKVLREPFARVVISINPRAAIDDKAEDES